MSIFEQRCEKAQKLMAEAGIDFLFIGGWTDARAAPRPSQGKTHPFFHTPTNMNK